MSLQAWGTWIGVALGLTAIAIAGGGSGEMLPNQVPATPTPTSPQEVYDALEAAWPTIIGTAPSRQSILVLLAQWDLETGGGQSMIQFNVGNFKANPATAEMWCEFMTTEVVNGVTEHVSQPFRAYPDLASGVAAYLQAMHGRFGSAWPYVESGDLNGFAQALKDAGYYTASESLYAAGLQARYAKLDSEIA